LRLHRSRDDLGDSRRRLEDRPLLTGHGRFAADISCPRSPWSKASAEVWRDKAKSRQFLWYGTGRHHRMNPALARSGSATSTNPTLTC